MSVMRFWRPRPIAMFALMLLLGIVLASILAPLWTSSPTEGIPTERLQPPSSQHWLGTDNFGRDVLSRIVYGARVSLVIGVAVMSMSTILGTAVGLIAGYYRKWDNVIMRVIDGLLAFPSIILAIAIAASLGNGIVNEILALSVAYFPRTARIVRSATLQLREMLFVEAAVAVGVPDSLILRKYIFRNAMNSIIVQATFVFAEAILADAALSFIGLGVQPPHPTWGNMLADARSFMVIAPWFFVFPGLAIVVTVLSINLLGDTLRDLLDPRSQQRGVQYHEQGRTASP